MIFRFTDEEIMNEIKEQFPNKGTISKPTLSRIKREIKTRNMNMYNNMKKTQDLFLSKVLEKYKNIDTYIKEYFKIYSNETTSNILKIKILEKISELDRDQLRMQQDFPYLEIYHKDARDELATLDSDIKDFKEKTKETQDPKIPNERVSHNMNLNKMPIESITKDKEIQRILSSRTQSGFEGRL